MLEARAARHVTPPTEFLGETSPKIQRQTPGFMPPPFIPGVVFGGAPETPAVEGGDGSAASQAPQAGVSGGLHSIVIICELHVHLQQVTE